MWQMETEDEVTLLNAMDHNVIVDSIFGGWTPVCPNVVWAQAVHETGMFTSKIALECNNWFGMKVRTRFPSQYQKGHCRGHAKYESSMDSIKDYIEWQSIFLPAYLKKNRPKYYKTWKVYRNIPNEVYYDFLKYQGYAEDKSYIPKVKRWVKVIEESPEISERVCTLFGIEPGQLNNSISKH